MGLIVKSVYEISAHNHLLTHSEVSIIFSLFTRYLSAVNIHSVLNSCVLCSFFLYIPQQAFLYYHDSLLCISFAHCFSLSHLLDGHLCPSCPCSPPFLEQCLVCISVYYVSPTCISWAFVLVKFLLLSLLYFFVLVFKIYHIKNKD